MDGEVVLDVPFYSQHRDVSDPYWQSRACGIAVLAMVFEYYTGRKVSLDDLIKEGEELGGFGPSGWVHDKLILLAKRHGLEGVRHEFKSSDTVKQEALTQKALDTFVEMISKEKPVIISAVKNFSEEKKFHLVALVGFRRGNKGNLLGFYYHDPDGRNDEDGKNRFVDSATFKKYFRGLAIYITKTSINR